MTASPLDTERARSSFNVRELTFLLDGGRKNTEHRERVEALVESDPVFANADLYTLSRPQRYQRAMQKQRRVVELAKESGLTEGEIRNAVHDELGTDLQNLMFLPNLRATFSDEQQAFWMPRAKAWEVIGCYAQTELGHGSNVQGLETTATYLAETDEIEIHSPTTTSTKWWPGALGKTANHAIVYARLIVADKDYGIHNFMVQIRDMKTHEPMPGVTVGDIGPKIGYNNQDNGFCRFEHVRIPRTNMAMRYATLRKGGEYVAAAERRAASYSSMTHVRSLIVMGSGNALSRACTIAVRYSAVRHQGRNATGDGETCVLDYTMQQQRLLPLVAASYAFHFTGVAMRELIRSGDVSAIHIASSGLKSLVTRIAGDGIEACRKACGGHGYLLSSGLPELLGSYLQNATVEGENYMIAQQTARGLFKLYREGLPSRPAARERGQQPVAAVPVAAAVTDAEAGATGYLLDAGKAASLRCGATCATDFLSPALQCEAFRQRAAWLVMKTDQQLADLAAEGTFDVDAWNLTCPDIIRTSDAHCFYVMVRNFCEAVEKINKSHPALAPVLRTCCHLFTLWWMQEGLGDLLEGGYLDAAQAGMLRQAVREQLAALRPDAVALVDAWGHSDHALNSALGRYDGQVYEGLLASVSPEANPMNKDAVTPAFAESLLPMRQASRL